MKCHLKDDFNNWTSHSTYLGTLGSNDLCIVSCSRSYNVSRNSWNNRGKTSMLPDYLHPERQRLLWRLWPWMERQRRRHRRVCQTFSWRRGGFRSFLSTWYVSLKKGFFGRDQDIFWTCLPNQIQKENKTFAFQNIWHINQHRPHQNGIVQPKRSRNGIWLHGERRTISVSRRGMIWLPSCS